MDHVTMHANGNGVEKIEKANGIKGDNGIAHGNANGVKHSNGNGIAMEKVNGIHHVNVNETGEINGIYNANVNGITKVNANGNGEANVNRNDTEQPTAANGTKKTDNDVEKLENGNGNGVPNGNDNGSAEGEGRKGLCAGLMIFRLIGSTRIEYLMLKASNMKNHWTPPKGHLESGETPFEAAIRETFEEAQLGPNDYELIHGFFASVQYEGTKGLKYVSYWPARLKDVDHKIEISEEHLAYKWCDIDTLDEICTRESTTRAYRDLEKFIRANCLIQGGSDGN